MTQTKALELALCLSCQEPESIEFVSASAVIFPACAYCGELGLYTVEAFAELVPEISAELAEELDYHGEGHYWA